MILPKKFGAKKPAPVPKNKYEDSTKVRMLLLPVEDVFMQKFKDGWFTLFKFTEEVLKKP